jgi:hypothetical protein
VKQDAVATAWRERAAQIIEDRGWCQSAFVDEFGQVCLAGAIIGAFDLDPKALLFVDDLDVWTPAVREAIDALGLEVMPADPDDADDHDTSYLLDVLGLWNDAVGRSKDDVIALLRRAS